MNLPKVSMKVPQLSIEAFEMYIDAMIIFSNTFSDHLISEMAN